ncbi:amidoligase family protein [Pleionea sediminis]|uniref:amidoligase family protein n=1 Tax=Pleionea sediminis TaxID=2569479 RepID=UPI0011870BD0|nr:amidoligase family protein [Pleionea sediminis]
MSIETLKNWLPTRIKNVEGNERKVGIELEFSGCEPEDILACITDNFGGEVEKRSVFEYSVVDTDFGDFTVELDAQLLQKIVTPSSEETVEDKLIQVAEGLLKSAAEQLVPWEVVAPPVKISELHQLENMIKCLRNKGALGTRHAMRYAFGLHLNPELPDFEASTLVRFMQAYLCLYDWIYAKEKIDVVRKITPYIDHFGKDYILKVVNPEYSPNKETFIKDYLEFNPTRNRSLDWLPLFAHFDKEWIKGLKEEALIKSRPTLHYRLPNCDIDNTQWNLQEPWSYWLKVEALANQPDKLEHLMEEFREDYQRFTRALDGQWIKRCEEFVSELE